MNKMDAIFVFTELIASRKSTSTNLVDRYVSELVEGHGVWRISELIRTKIERGRGSWY